MSMLPKRWVVAPPAPVQHLRQYKGMSPVLAQVLYNRGFDTPEDAHRFLYVATFDGNPFQMKDMSKAVGRIRAAIKRGEPIAVYGDFDADGVTSTTLLMQVLRALGARVMPYIPHRIDEGYGLNSPALRHLAKKGVKLVITVDCGIRSVQEIEDGKAAGLDIIITDHHSIGPEIPEAFAVINPQQVDCQYPEKKLAGVGVAYKVADALLRATNANGRRSGHTLQSDDLLDLVAIGTVADLMPLNKTENRVLVRQGLQVINRAQRFGVKALMDVAGVQPGQATAMSIGFGLGPRINAAGRLDSAMVAYKLLAANNSNDAVEYAKTLQSLNTKRQELTRDAQDMIREQLEESSQQDAPLIFAGNKEFLPGIVGLVAGRLAEEYYRPAVVLEEGEAESRASCRSIPQFDITQALDECADLLVRHGGHAAAAGFTVLNENIPALRDRLTDIARDALHGQELVPTLEVDMELDIRQLTEHLVEELTILEPTGYHHDSPVFITRDLPVAEHRTVGSDGSHLKLRFSRNGNPPLDAIAFGLGEWDENMPERLDVAFRLEINEWNGRRTLQMNVQDIRPAGVQV